VGSVERKLGIFMATAKTGSFYLTQTVSLPATSAPSARVTATVDLSAYVNVPTGQAIAIESVDFVYQYGPNYSSAVSAMLAVGNNGALQAQLTDLNPSTVFVRADNHSLIASGALNIDQVNNIGTQHSDLYPDNFGPANLSEAFLVVNDTLYLTGGVDAATTGAEINYISVRIRCRVVKLNTKDWMAIAIQSTAEA